MMKTSKRLGQLGALCGLVFAGLFLAGCQSDSGAHFVEGSGVNGPAAATTAGGVGAAAVTAETEIYKFKPADAITITYLDAPTPVPAFQDSIKEDGTITLIENQTFTAAGKTRRQLEQEIRERYVPNIFKKLTVLVDHQQQTRFYYVLGEVKSPNREVYIGPIRVLEAISSVGDFTDFANKSKVQLTRTDGRTFKIDCKKALRDPSLNLEVYPGDKIWVPRKSAFSW
jgi:polysaccharide export outer membrane protein